MSATLDTEVMDFAHAIGRMVRRVRAAASDGELSGPEGQVLGRLDRLGPATSAELAREQGMKPQSMGPTIAALQERGYLERTPHPSDGRQMLVTLTAKGAETRKRIVEAKLGWLRDRLEALPDRERATLVAAGRIIERVLDDEQR